MIIPVQSRFRVDFAQQLSARRIENSSLYLHVGTLLTDADSESTVGEDENNGTHHLIESMPHCIYSITSSSTLRSRGVQAATTY
jgi:hypothetical protein